MSDCCLLAIGKNTAMNIGVHASVKVPASVLLSVHHKWSDWIIA